MTSTSPSILTIIEYTPSGRHNLRTIHVRQGRAVREMHRLSPKLKELRISVRSVGLDPTSEILEVMQALCSHVEEVQDLTFLMRLGAHVPSSNFVHTEVLRPILVDKLTWSVRDEQVDPFQLPWIPLVRAAFSSADVTVRLPFGFAVGLASIATIVGAGVRAVQVVDGCCVNAEETIPVIPNVERFWIGNRREVDITMSTLLPLARAMPSLTAMHIEGPVKLPEGVQTWSCWKNLQSLTWDLPHMLEAGNGYVALEPSHHSLHTLQDIAIFLQLARSSHRLKELSIPRTLREGRSAAKRCFVEDPIRTNQLYIIESRDVMFLKAVEQHRHVKKVYFPAFSAGMAAQLAHASQIPAVVLFPSPHRLRRTLDGRLRTAQHPHYDLPSFPWTSRAHVRRAVETLLSVKLFRQFGFPSVEDHNIRRWWSINHANLIRSLRGYIEFIVAMNGRERAWRSAKGRALMRGRSRLPPELIQQILRLLPVTHCLSKSELDRLNALSFDASFSVGSTPRSFGRYELERLILNPHIWQGC